MKPNGSASARGAVVVAVSTPPGRFFTLLLNA
jgi:hypothetical protein